MSTPAHVRPALRAVDAAFRRGAETLVSPFSAEIAPGDCVALPFANDRAATIAARMASGIVKATSGTLLVCDFDPRIQPVQAKRLAGYVPYAGNFGDSLAAHPTAEVAARRRADLIALHAALFEVGIGHAKARVRATLEGIGWSDDVTFAIALATIRPLSLLVLDRPPAAVVARMSDVLGDSTAVMTMTTRAPEAAAALVAP